MNRKQTGLTLIEVMVTVGIIAILAGISWPLYERQQIKNRRVDGITTMLDLKNQLERCFYSADAAKGFGEGTFEGCGYLVPAQTDRQFYNLNFAVTMDGTLNPGKQGVGYTLTATRVPGGVMDDDTDCDVFTLTNTGVRTAVKSDTTVNNACWGSN